MRSIVAAAACVGGLLSGFMPAAHAADYPDKPIHLIVPYGPGGASDIFARLIGKDLTERLGQPVVVENRPGAGGSAGAAYVAKSKPDGYTMLLSDIAVFAISPQLYPNLPYKKDDLVPVINIGVSPQLLITGSTSKLKSFKEVLDSEKAHPGGLNIASSGIGTGTHLAAVLLNTLAGTHVVHVPYKGGGPALSDVVSNHVDMMFIGTPPAMPLINSGQVRVLAVSAKKRVPALPDVPTLAESGAPGFEAVAGQGIFFPAETPAAIVDRMNKEIGEILQQPESRKRWSDFGAEFEPNTPAQDRQWLQQEADKWGKLIREADIKPD